VINNRSKKLNTAILIKKSKKSKNQKKVQKLIIFFIFDFINTTIFQNTANKS
jgi:hypothetical protein